MAAARSTRSATGLRHDPNPVDACTLGYTLPLMSEKMNVQAAATAALYQEQLAEYREKLGWVRDYL